MFKLFSTQASQVFVRLLDLYGGNFGSYLPIALENELLNKSQTWVGTF